MIISIPKYSFDIPLTVIKDKLLLGLLSNSQFQISFFLQKRKKTFHSLLLVSILIV